MQKQAFLLLLIFLCTITSCTDNELNIKTYNISVQLIYPADSQPREGVKVKLTGATTTSIFVATTNSEGVAEFTVVSGIYTASAYESRTEGNNLIFFNGTKSNIIASDTQTETPTGLDLLKSKTSALVIKEIYCGGCQKDDGSGAFTFDDYIILYNNSDAPVSLKNLCIASAQPGNAHASNYFIQSGELIYKDAGWIPAGYGIWVIQNEPVLAAGKQIVISLENSIDNTQTYSNSINFANPEYYAAYDIAVYTHTSYYKVSEVIPTSHYLKGYKLANVTATALTFSVNSPAVFIFQPAENIDIAEYVSNPDNIAIHGSSASQANLKTPVEWVKDAVESFQTGQEAKSIKRLTDNVDAGYVYMTNTYGYTLYRNVNKEATESVAENTGKIIYGYDKGTDGIVANGTTDPSNIDAEASIKNGARIIYQDTNNSTNDFHQRKQASLKN
jgi:hypothetical protein